jgi:hypothetical protein
MGNSSVPREFDTQYHSGATRGVPTGSRFSTTFPERIRPRCDGAHHARGGIMSRNTYALAAAAMAIGLVASGCSNSTDSATKSTSSTSAASATQLQSLIPAPANSQRTDGPDSIPNSGIHLHFVVNGSSTDVMSAYKTALEGKGWAVTVVSSGGWQGAGGATYTTTQGDTYGVFSGGGSESTTDVSACAWPSKPANPNCGGGSK